MFQVFGTLCHFSSRSFLKQLASHISADTLQLKFQGIGGLAGGGGGGPFAGGGQYAITCYVKNLAVTYPEILWEYRF